MRSVVIGAIAAAMVAVYVHTGDTPVRAEQIVAQPPAKVYGELDALYAAIEQRSANVTPVVGHPPTPVKLTFEREPGRMLGLKATGGFRSAWIKTWIEPGDGPGETRLKVAVWPETMLERAGRGDVHSAVQAVLHQTQAQLGPGKEIAALFGKPHETDTSHAECTSAQASVASESTKPMVDASIPTSAH